MSSRVKVDLSKCCIICLDKRQGDKIYELLPCDNDSCKEQFSLLSDDTGLVVDSNSEGVYIHCKRDKIKYTFRHKFMIPVCKNEIVKLFTSLGYNKIKIHSQIHIDDIERLDDDIKNLELECKYVKESIGNLSNDVEKLNGMLLEMMRIFSHGQKENV
jgi:hypothetical protein